MSNISCCRCFCCCWSPFFPAVFVCNSFIQSHLVITKIKDPLIYLEIAQINRISLLMNLIKRNSFHFQNIYFFYFSSLHPQLNWTKIHKSSHLILCERFGDRWMVNAIKEARTQNSLWLLRAVKLGAECSIFPFICLHFTIWKKLTSQIFRLQVKKSWISEWNISCDFQGYWSWRPYFIHSHRSMPFHNNRSFLHRRILSPW